MRNTDFGILNEAILFATKAHDGMVRKGTSVPYIFHPIEAASIVATMTDEAEVIAAAVLHDVLEDTPVTEEELRAVFGNKIADFVRAESENKREYLPASETWKVRKQETIDQLKNEARKEVKMIALGDKLSNMRAIARDFEVVGDRLWERFNQTDIGQQAWYYASVAEAVSELKKHQAWHEYNRLIGSVFKNAKTHSRK